MNRPAFNQVNIVVRDMAAAIEFYRRLGLDISAPMEDWPPGSGALHVEAQPAPPANLDLDNVAMATIWGHRSLGPGSPVIGFSMASRDAVDEKYAELIAAGYAGRVEPYDAFFGARYAIVEDPDGHNIGLMSPVDRRRQYTPDL